MNVGNVIDRLKNHQRRYGVKATIHQVQSNVINTFMYFEILRGMTVTLQDVTDPEMFEAPGFEGRFVETGVLEQFARAGTHELDIEFLSEAVRREDRCYGIFAGKDLASYGWYSQRPTAIDDHFTLHFDPSYTYMYKGYTLPGYRGERLHAMGMSRGLRAFTEEGKAGLVTYVASNNFASLKSLARMGYRIFGGVYLARGGRHAAAYATPGCKPYGFRVETTRARGDLGTARAVGSFSFL